MTPSTPSGDNTINDKNLNSEIETGRETTLEATEFSTINDKNLNSEIETRICLP